MNATEAAAEALGKLEQAAAEALGKLEQHFTPDVRLSFVASHVHDPNAGILITATTLDVIRETLAAVEERAVPGALARRAILDEVFVAADRPSAQIGQVGQRQREALIQEAAACIRQIEIIDQGAFP